MIPRASLSAGLLALAASSAEAATMPFSLDLDDGMGGVVNDRAVLVNFDGFDESLGTLTSVGWSVDGSATSMADGTTNFQDFTVRVLGITTLVPRIILDPGLNTIAESGVLTAPPLADVLFTRFLDDFAVQISIANDSRLEAAESTGTITFDFAFEPAATGRVPLPGGLALILGALAALGLVSRRASKA